MSRVEYCLHRTDGSSQRAEIFIANQPPVQEKPTKICLILKQKGVADPTCYNLDLNHTSCPIALESQEKGIN